MISLFSCLNIHCSIRDADYLKWFGWWYGRNGHSNESLKHGQSSICSVPYQNSCLLNYLAFFVKLDYVLYCHQSIVWKLSNLIRSPRALSIDLLILKSISHCEYKFSFIVAFIVLLSINVLKYENQTETVNQTKAGEQRLFESEVSLPCSIGTILSVKEWSLQLSLLFAICGRSKR